MMTEMKLPACYAVIDENEMTYLDGGATIADSDAYKAFLNVGQVFNQLALGECDIRFPYQVPENRYFVLGDHRSVSIDSRSSVIGCVEKSQVVGRVFLRIWPLNRLAVF